MKTGRGVRGRRVTVKGRLGTWVVINVTTLGYTLRRLENFKGSWPFLSDVPPERVTFVRGRYEAKP